MTSPAEIAELVKAQHDRLGSMIDQVGHPDYSLREMVNGMREVRDELLRAAAALEKVGRDKELLDWAETHPEATMREFTSWWVTAGRGGRENHFAFRKIIDAAISAEGK